MQLDKNNNYHQMVLEIPFGVFLKGVVIVTFIGMFLLILLGKLKGGGGGVHTPRGSTVMCPYI